MATTERQRAARRELARRELSKRQEKKTILSIVGESFRGAARETGGQALNILNSLLLGAPEEIARRRGGRFVPQGLDPTAKVAGGLLGTITGPVGAAGQRIGRAAIRGTGGLATTARAGIQGAITGALIPPEENFNDLAARGKQALIGGILSAGTASIGKAATRFKQTIDPKRTSRVMKFIRNRFFRIKRRAVQKFGSQLDDLANTNPEARLSLRDLVDDINSEAQGYTAETKRLLRRAPGMKRLLDNPKLANELTAKESQNILNSLRTKIPNNIRFKDLDLLDVETSIRAAQLDAFPEMSAIRQEYSKVIQPFNQVKNKFKFNTLQNAITNDFGGAEGREAVNQLFADDPKTLKAIGGFRGAQKTLKGAKALLRRLLFIGAGGAVAGATFRAFSGDEGGSNTGG